jgi:pyruvate/2-oxoglutarate/acetoin dehydrogenase E1 component
MGMTTGLALTGLVPVSIFPRWNFLLYAINQLVNHLDKVQVMSDGRYTAKAIIRTGIGAQRPLHPQQQHVGDFTEAVRALCTTIDVVRLEEPRDVFPAYQHALLREDGRSTIIVEYGDYYGEK